MAIKRNIFFILSEIREKIIFNDDDLSDVYTRISSLHLFDEVSDFRQAGKITYKLDDLLLLVFLVILEEGKQSFEYIADYIEINYKKYEKLGLLSDNHYPSHDTLRRVFSLLDSQSLKESTIYRFYEFLNKLQDENNSLKHIAVDGKFINATGRKEESNKPSGNLNVLNIYCVSNNTCLYSEVVGEKTNEIPVAQDLLSNMDLKGCVVTADALHCQKRTCKIIKAKKGHYVLNAKDNQELLQKDIEARFNNPKNIKKIKTITSEDEKMSVSFLKLPNGYDDEGFTGMRTFVKMESKRRNNNNVCIRYFISDLIKAQDIYEAIKARWALETHHQLKDVYLNEDEFRCTDKKAAKNISIINNLITQLLKIYIPLSGRIPRKAKIALRSDPIGQMGLLLSLLDSETIKNKMIEASKK